MNPARRLRILPVFALLCATPVIALPHDPLGAALDSLLVRSSQGWGALGIDTAAAPAGGRPGSPLQLGETTFAHGIGHHAPGELVFTLPPDAYTAFAAEVGVHWQGGGKGSVIFQVFVDGALRFDSGIMTDSDPAQSVNVSLAGARELRLVSGDAGDGIACDMANWANARLLRDPDAPQFGLPSVLLSGEPAPAPSYAVASFYLIANASGPQVAALGESGFAVCVNPGEVAELVIPAANVKTPFSIEATVEHLHGEGAEVIVSVDGGEAKSVALVPGPNHIVVAAEPTGDETAIRLSTRGGGSGESLVRWRNLRWVTDRGAKALQALPDPPAEEVYPPPQLPALRPGMESALIEWDWRMQDGIETEREAVTYAAAIERTIARGGLLLSDLQESGVALEELAVQWQGVRDTLTRLIGANLDGDDPAWETLWREAHHLRRRIALSNPLAAVGPLVFAKHITGDMSHQLTQYYGRCARAGGGLFVLELPGQNMRTRALTQGQLPEGSFMQPEVSYDGDRILFAYCEVSSMIPQDDPARLDRFYHLYEIRPDGLGLRQLTEGPYNDFSPKELPNGKLMFISTRRGGYHRCGAGPCDVYTLAVAEADGSAPRTVSYHETQEWDPAVLEDGRVIYTRWDYVDRNAVHYQQLWVTHPDGSSPLAYYGNNTLNPVGVWEARPVSGSSRVMATAAAHHAMTAGSIILLDTTRGIDGLAPITRLTPDAPFPESETYVLPKNWHAPGSPKDYVTPEEERRWPGHCYRSPFPLSEKYFLAAYSFDALIGEPDANKANMFGLYLVDAFGNKELIYRDLNIASQWPVPLRARHRPPVLPDRLDPRLGEEGTYFVQDVYQSNVELPPGSVKGLRILQVLPKTTPHANNPPVGLANASPGRQVLGTAPVEEDGSAFFRAPARLPLSFQVLDERGQAIHTMRSITYLQPGEQASCVGCHEDRMSAPPHAPAGLALRRDPSALQPGPDGSKPLSYPLLVQPVLDKHCVSCHGAEPLAGSLGPHIDLTGAPEGHYTKSYVELAKRVPYSAWGASLEDNSEPAAGADRFGARASELMKMLFAGHEGVELASDEIERLVTWMDANALFYGTFRPEDQARQQRGERIEGPALE
ncbi:MAG: NPCBM/NEW2 domain-containing protein [Candidatus Hydrogenedentes bacterium]|nr:NPCBM/NEW2 domain-containing protein [Candidatus Hydrogenedentota bacterium]